MRIKVDFDLCQGHGECEGEAPEVFVVDEDGKMTVLQEEPPEELREKVLRARKYCPTMAITLED
ncbi:MAG: ferredoxin [Myxococcales bacterium]|jgi:ferredoxin|nr:ferredoxin [Myxococcales bacterium]